MFTIFTISTSLSVFYGANSTYLGKFLVILRSVRNDYFLITGILLLPLFKGGRTRVQAEFPQDLFDPPDVTAVRLRIEEESLWDIHE